LLLEGYFFLYPCHICCESPVFLHLSI